jgi:hypothetical protein
MKKKNSLERVGEAVHRHIAEQRQRKRPVTVTLPEDLIGELRNAAIHFAGPPLRLTLATIIEHAVRRELDRLRVEHNHGKKIPTYEGAALRAGRPLGS